MFASVVDAGDVRTKSSAAWPNKIPMCRRSKRIQLRIGVRVGDVIVEEKDIFGDAVNIAVRLEDIAEPGGICISDDARRQIRAKIGLDYAESGSQR